MTSVESELALLRDPRLAALATSAWPAWLWSADASQIVWANAVGAALFGAADTIALAARRFDVKNPAATQIIRLAATLPPAGAPRLERLRGFGLGFGRTLTCACSRIAIGNGQAAVLITATEPAGPALPLAERVRRLFADDPQPLAAFAADGALLYASATARSQFNGANSLAALGIDGIAAKTLESGTTRTARYGQDGAEATFQRLGVEAERILLLALPRLPQLRPSEMVEPKVEDDIAAAVPAPLPPQHVEAAAAPPPQAEAIVAPAATEAEAVSPPPSATTLPPHAEPPRPPEAPAAERRHPLRFVWQMDAEGRFVVGSDEFVALVGPRTMAAFGRKWSDIVAELTLDPDNQVARAVASHETWSGITLNWPVDEASERLPVELSGLPVFDRERSFRGYRGFGVCRDVDRINQLTRSRRERPLGFMPAPEVPPPADDVAVPEQPAPASVEAPAAAPAPSAERAAPLTLPAAANVVPFRPSPTAEPKAAPTLSPVERKAFRELAQELTARLRGTPDAPSAGEPGVEGALAPKAPDEIDDEQPATPLPGNDATPDGAAAASAIATPEPAAGIDPALLDRIPLGVLVYRHDALIYANRHFLGWTGYDTLDALSEAGGLDTLFIEPSSGPLAEGGGTQSLSIMTRRGDTVPVEGRLFTVPWNGASALALILTNGQAAERRQATEAALAAAEAELRNAKREVQKAASEKADFVAKVSHEIRTPLNAMTGFAEVMMAERFGPIGNERYRDYLKDIHGAGNHIAALLNDLLDLSKVETGRLDLSFGNVGLNDLTSQCVGIMQPQANRARIIIRTSLTPALPQILADERTLRQIVLNLIANAIKFTGPGGQVIVSTALSDNRDVVLRVRDTGIGMSEADVAAALEPFRQVATAGSWGSGGTGLGLPLTKALAEANRANFNIKSGPNAGTLVEIAFPASRLAAE
jgi:signal transduction histidine kinase